MYSIEYQTNTIIIVGLGTSKKRRKVLPAQIKRGDAIHIEKEGPSYEYGGH